MWSLPNTCFSCVHYQQKGYQDDALAEPLKDQFGFERETKAQRFGMCTMKGCHVFWNESKCPAYQCEPGIDTHPCKPRKAAMQPHQDLLI
ncbi:TPA: hypothetical protein AB5E57_001611 [Vibrio cholerae]|uniref:hypothetical protein n=1 Tax=Vibrio cholerae TaxID=666 RepID=UPI0011579147|nr:hypothetical protein [Vibrio cholerae]MDV2340940.1 hypothetical protein [Vibrio cholerae]TQP68481.1 hypothetical protein FLL76_00620 [Vibrio cholerae]